MNSILLSFRLVSRDWRGPFARRAVKLLDAEIGRMAAMDPGKIEFVALRWMRKSRLLKGGLPIMQGPYSGTSGHRGRLCY